MKSNFMKVLIDDIIIIQEGMIPMHRTGGVISIEEWENLRDKIDRFVYSFDYEEYERERVIEEVKRKQENERQIELSKNEKKLRNLEGEVYFIKSETGHFKIGYSKNSKNRMKTLQTSSPFKLNLYKSLRFDNAAKAEAYFHEIFSERKTNSEWFDITEDEIDRILDKLGLVCL